MAADLTVFINFDYKAYSVPAFIGRFWKAGQGQSDFPLFRARPLCSVRARSTQIRTQVLCRIQTY